MSLSRVTGPLKKHNGKTVGWGGHLLLLQLTALPKQASGQSLNHSGPPFPMSTVEVQTAALPCCTKTFGWLAEVRVWLIPLPQSPMEHGPAYSPYP